ncbi:MAG TPA: UvrD-helicase domain-containing protein, partial [Patescibacteria group bacterium]|nr:UvrD-helicase domain-containing protein [Patescibacteria group bacterium]
MILESLNKEQKEAVVHENGPLLIIAGAGTGKTTVITRRIAWLILEKKIKPDEILALTFTEKASAEMEERVDRLLPYGYVDLWISTFHGFAEKILRLHGLDIGLPTNFRVLSDTEQWYLVRKNLDKFNLDYYRPLGNPTKFIHALLKHFSRAKDEEISPEEYLKYAEELKLNQDTDGESDILEIKRLEEVANAYHIYQKILLENNALDFGDLINYVLKLFKIRHNILDNYRRQFKYILVDEFQDTNWAQYELVKLLAEPNNNLTVVGDDDQSIYKFRGASISNILTFKKDFQKSRDILLTENYRSTQNILDLSYGFIQQNNPNRLEARMNEKKSNGGLENISKKLAAQTKESGIIEYILA